MSSCPSIKRNETARQAYIRLLSAESEKTDNPDRDTMFRGDLIKAGYLEGDVLPDSFGGVDEVKTLGITLEGRLFEQNMRKLEREESIWGRSLAAIWVLVGYVFGFLSPVLSDLICSWLK